MKLLKNTIHPIGLDISDLSLKMFQLSSRGSNIAINAVSRVELPRGIMESGEIKNRDELVKSLKKLVEDPAYGKVGNREVAACLPEHRTFIKLIELGKNPNSIQEIVLSEIEKDIPLPIQDVYYDWQIISENPEHKMLLIGASPKIIVDEYIDVFRAADLTVVAMEIESIATCRALLAEENPFLTTDVKHSHAMIDIGSKGTTMIVYSGGTIVFSVSVPISSDQVTEKIAQTLKIDMEQAEKAKIICGLDECKAEGVVREVILSLVDELVKKIKSILRFYQHHYAFLQPIESVILTGGGANIEKIDLILSQALGLPVIKGDVFTNMPSSRENWKKILTENKNLNWRHGNDEALSETQDTSSSYATAIGLALRDVFLSKKNK